MTTTTDLLSSDALPTKQTGEPPTAEEFDCGSALTAMNPFLARWPHAIAGGGSLPSEALAVAIAMARAVGIPHVAFPNWQRINTALGRNRRRDVAVLETMPELELEGYLDHDDGFVYGWMLLVSEGQL